MRRLDYNSRSHGIRLLVCEIVRSRKARLLVFCMILLFVGLASRVPTEVKQGSIFMLRGSTVYASSANAARLGEESSNRSAPESSTEFRIQDIVLLPDDILVLIPMPGNDGQDPGPDYSLPPKEQLSCFFKNVIPTSVTGLDYFKGRALVRCRPPKEYPAASIAAVTRVAAADGPLSNSSLVNSDAIKHFGNVCLLKGSRVVASAANTQTSVHVKTWHYLVFEMWATENDVVLFAKGINTKQGHNVSPNELVCVYGDDDGDDTQVVETNVSISAQEVFRCAHPPSKYRRSLMGRPVTLRWGTKLLPTVAFYTEISSTHMLEHAGAPAVAAHIPAAPQHIPAGQDTAPVKEICVCTMIFNVAKFLPEWGSFHSHVGVDRFILYDNNSEDELGEALRWLTDRHLQVNRYPWPWPKTQEAGFSHCVLAARQSCDWVLFADVDEFLFPATHLPPSGRHTPLRQLITEAERRDRPRWQQKDGTVESVHRTIQPAPVPRHLPTADQLSLTGRQNSEESSLPRPAGATASNRVGQISFFCRDFGPSNLTEHPTRGVTQGYVCRTKLALRHKSLVKVEAVAQDLQNVVHHFKLRPAYCTVMEHPNTAVVNHYKYQAWPEFRLKFRRRVSAYVADWKERRNMASRDRTPGLGSDAVKPTDWETSFCEVLDTALLAYCNTTFAVNSSTLAWQL